MFYGIKSSAFLLHETKIGKGGGVERAGWRGSGRCPSPSAWAMTPHFFLHNFWHLPACNAGSLSISEKRRVTHSSSCLENTAPGEAEKGVVRAGSGRLVESDCRGDQLGAWLG